MAAIFVAIPTLVIWTWSSKNSERWNLLPDDSEIEKVLASARKTDVGFSLPGTPEVSIPAEYIPRVMALFRPAVRNGWVGREWEPPIVDLTVITKGGRRIPIIVFWTGKTDLICAIDGVSSNRSGVYTYTSVSKDGRWEQYSIESLLLIEFLTGIERELATGVEDQKARDALENLERSAGKRAPHIIP